MNPDDFKQAWQAQASQTRLTIDVDLLLKEVQRNQQAFIATIFWRDFREIAVALLMIPLWFYLGARHSSPWTWYLTVPVLVWIAGFMLVYRLRHPQRPTDPDEPLLRSVRNSVTQVDDQIWLLRNVFWWYLLPPGISISAFFGHVTWLSSEDWLEALGGGGTLFAVLLSVYSFIYYLNQYAVRTLLEPRRQELLTLLTSLGNETTSGEDTVMQRAESVKQPGIRRRSLFFAGLCAVAVAALSAAAHRLGQEGVYPKRAPYTAIRWEGDKPQVQIGEAWFELVSLDGVAAEDIVVFSRRTYANLWRKRFEEDLVEVLSRMGHEPQDTVRLVVRPLGSAKTRTLEDVPMTEANRRSIREAAQARELREQKPAKQAAIPIGNAQVALTDLIADLRKEKELVGLAAMVTVDGEAVASAVDGERRKGSGVRLEIGDRWHLGSITKSITATMIARLVESGRMQWSDSIGEAFPDASIHEDWKPVTLKELLTHTAGAPANFSIWVALQRPAHGPECTRARREAVLKVLAEKPAHTPGEKHAYSNVGYTIAAAMAEKATGATWVDLVKREVFEPLKLNGAGFGPPQSPEKTLDQPRGHRVLLGRKIAMDDEADNTPIIGPAGAVHMTLRDLCTYATEHLRGEQGAGKLLSAETYKLLHAPRLGRYAFGWVKEEAGEDIPHTVYWHNGSNTMWYALVVFIPERNMVVAVTSNDGGRSNAEAAAWEIVEAGARFKGRDEGR